MFDVFISYSRADYQDKAGHIIPGNPVSKVTKALAAAGITYWFDTQRIYHGDDFAEKIVTNIESSDIFIFLSTANSNKSPWTRKEIASAHQFGKTIIPVKIDSSDYDKAVMFRIVDLDYIDYAKNPDKAVQELVDTVNGLLSEKRKAEWRRKAEEEQRRKEQEQQRKKAIADVELQLEKLKNDLSRLKLEYKQLLTSAQRIDDERERSRLTALVQNSFRLEDNDKDARNPHSATVKALSEENARLREEMKRLKKAPSFTPGTVGSEDDRKIPTLIKVFLIIALVVSILNAVFLLIRAISSGVDAANSYYPSNYIDTVLFALASIFSFVAAAGVVQVLKKRVLGFYLFSASVLAVGITTSFLSGSVLPVILSLIVIAIAFGLLKLSVNGVRTGVLLK